MTRNTESSEAAVRAAIRERRELVNDAIDEELPLAEPERLYEASRYLLEAGGKRLRPTVSLLAAEAVADVDPLSTDYREFPAVGGGTVDVMAAAVAIEIIQSFTLIHDDIMDEDDLRRGVPAVHREYDTETAILAGDTLYSKAFEVMLRTDAPPAASLESLRVLAETCTRICEGQAYDVEFEDRADVSVEEYLEMVRLKTAVLYGAAATVPAVVMGADDEVVDALYDYGIAVGQAFQIKDDVLDLTTSSEKLGKQRGSDLVENKQTIVTLHARDQGVDVANLVDADDPEDVTEAAVDEAVAVVEEVGSIDYARELAADLVAEGKSHLEALPDNEARRTLEDIGDFLIEREY